MKLRKYFTNLFISIIEEEDSYKLLCKVVKKGKLQDKFIKVFEVKSKDEKLDKEMEEYLISLQEKYKYTYIIVLLNSMGQGAIKGIEEEDFERASVELKSVRTVKFKTWSAYISFIDFNWIQKIYARVGIDLLYSPFGVLYNLLLRYKLKTKPTLYILNQEESVAISIFKGDTLYFGAFYKINKDDVLSSVHIDDWEDEEEESKVEGLASLGSERDEEDEEELSNLEDLSELDSFDIDTQDEEFADIKESSGVLSDSQMEDASVEDIELYGRDLEIYKFLNKALKEYYKDELYESDFIEQAVIFDAYNISQEMMDSIENDLLLDLQMHKIDMGEVVCDLGTREVYGEL